MSTRGCVAIGTPGSWRGVYNHWDSYPTGLGRKLWDHLHPDGKLRDLNTFAQELLQYGDWREYLNNGICPYCGKRAGQPHSIGGQICEAYVLHNLDPDEYQRYIQKYGYPDPDAKYHQHGNGPEDQITSDAPDPLFIEWVYVVNPKTRRLFVLARKYVPMPSDFSLPDEQTWCVLIETPEGKAWWYPGCSAAYRHILVAAVDLQGPEPDWEAIEDSAYKN